MSEKIKGNVTNVEIFNKVVEQGEAGDLVWVCLRGVKRSDMKRGMLITEKGTASSYNSLQSHVHHSHRDIHKQCMGRI